MSTGVPAGRRRPSFTVAARQFLDGARMMSAKLLSRSDRSRLRGNEQSLDDFCHNELFDVLGNRRRRCVLWYLHNEESPIESRELARQIAAWERSGEREDVPSSLYQSVYNALNQSHLPKLEGGGFIEFDKQQNLVYPTTRMAEVELFIDSVVPRTADRSMDRLRTLSYGVIASVLAGSFFLYLGSEPYLAPLAMVVLFSAFVMGELMG